jgi:hypothetical protein
MQSPPLFTAATETVADLTNQALLASAPAGPHQLDVVSESDGPVPALAPPVTRGALAHQAHATRTTSTSSQVLGCLCG